ncbi:hypothetical protein A3K73_06620 [Candidatus Pacearchaeota archaeon RBG_13_36_9]|nr:MAG: hypothetical protein A3K73_06620 [Candidatus Pacearchaeota archaeon RBG_13_36_9]
MGEEKIIKEAPANMQEMLRSVYSFNSRFGNKKLLKKIISSMAVLDRRFFVKTGLAYDDNALPIGKGQTISQPSTVARMLVLAELKEGDDVLEVGTGSGWNAALISLLVYPGSAVSVDRISSLVERAKINVENIKEELKKKNLNEHKKLENLYLLNEDIFAERSVWKKSFDKIIITAGVSREESEKKVEKVAEELLKEGGILICPYVSGPMVIYRKNGKLKREETKEQYVFVPLIEGVE